MSNYDNFIVMIEAIALFLAVVAAFEIFVGVRASRYKAASSSAIVSVEALKSAMGKEHRRHPRFPLIFRVLLNGNKVLHTGDVSISGCFVRGYGKLKRGDVVSLVLSFPDLFEPLSIRGIVRWALEGGTGVLPQSMTGFGVQWLDDEEARAAKERLEPLLDNRQAQVSNQCARILCIDPRESIRFAMREAITRPYPDGHHLVDEVVSSLLKLSDIRDHEEIRKVLERAMWKLSVNRDIRVELAEVVQGENMLKRLGKEHYDLIVMGPKIDGEKDLASQIRSSTQRANPAFLFVDTEGFLGTEEIEERGIAIVLNSALELNNLVFTMKTILYRVGKRAEVSHGC